jgi:hypothetical protein
MEPVLPNAVLPAASKPRGPAEQGEKADTPGAEHSVESRFWEILMRAAARQEEPVEGRHSARSGECSRNDGKEDRADASALPSGPSAAPGSGAPAAAAAPAPDEGGSAAAGPVPVFAGRTAVPAGGDPLPGRLSLVPAPAADGGNSAAPAQPPGAVVRAPAAAPAPNDADSATAGPFAAFAGPASGDPAQEGAQDAGKVPLPGRLSLVPAPAADGGKSAAPAQPPGAFVRAPAPAATAAPAPNDSVPPNAADFTVPAGSGSGDPAQEGAQDAGKDPLPGRLFTAPATADGGKSAAPPEPPGAAAPAPAATAAPNESVPPNAADFTVPAGPGSGDPATEAAQDVEGGGRKRKDDPSARTDGRSGPLAPQPADVNRGIAEKTAAPRPVGAAPDPGAVRFEENAFVITRKSETSVEVTLAPPGVGKLEIEVVLEKGIVNARITAADPAGREAIARNLPQIVEALARDGMNIGGFTVSLKERRDRTGDAPAGGASRHPGLRPLSAVPPAASASAASAGRIDIFV